MPRLESLVDRIYEAALVPSLWPDLLTQLCGVVGGQRGVMFAVRDGYAKGIVSPGWEDALQVFMRDWAHRDPLLGSAIQKNHAGFLTDHDLVDESVIADAAIYREFYRPNGMGFRAGTLIPVPSGDIISILLPRDDKLGPVSQSLVAELDACRPHLARASLTASRLGFERARAQAEALQALGLPGVVLGESARVIAANDLFEAFVPSLFQDRRQRLTIADEAADAMLGQALSAPDVAIPVRHSIPIRAAADRAPMVLHVVPVRGAAHDLFAQATWVVVVTPVDRAVVPTAGVLQGLFDLTPTEARVARAIGEARTIADVAQLQGVSRETIRSHVKGVLAKTGMSRQSELVSLLAGVGRVAQEQE